MKIGLASLNQHWENKQKNQKKAAAILEIAAKNHCDVVVFPEMTLTGFSMNIRAIAEPANGSSSIEFFKTRAKGKTAVVFGVVLRRGRKATNNLLAVSAQGKILANYAKVHPFSYAGETKFYIGGKNLKKAFIGGVPFGFSICYDLRFPEIFQALSKDVSVIVNIANWPESRLDHWKTLLKARAIENQVFMVGVNRTGHDGKGIAHRKSSTIVDPTGKILSPYKTIGDLDIVQINPALVRNERRRFPIKKDRRPKLYRRFL